MQRKQIQSISFIALLAIMLILMSRLFLPFASVILWASVFYGLFSPVYNRILHFLKPHKPFFEVKRHVLAGLFSLGTVLLMGSVFFLVGFKLIGQGRYFLEETRRFLEVNPLFFSNTESGTAIAMMVKRISLGTVDLAALDLKSEVLRFLASYSETIIDMTKSLAKNIGGFFLSLAFMSFALYFFYVDGAYLANVLIHAIPIDQNKTRKLLSKCRDVTSNLFMGFFLVAFYQALAAFIIFSIFRVQGSLLFSVLILFSSFVPLLGCALIWFPIGLSVLLTNGFVSGVVFMILCAVFISFLDNFLRPFFLKDRIKIHPLLIFFSILGGINAFGFNGILLGPIIVILFFMIVDIALEEELNLSDRLGPAEEPREG